MICPHCNHGKFKDFDESYFSCRNCGTLVAKDIPAIPMRSEPVKKLAHTHSETKTATYMVCDKFRNSIHDQRKNRASWESITSLLKVATKTKLCVKSVQKYSLIVIGYDPFPAPVSKKVIEKLKKTPRLPKLKKTLAEKCRVITKAERREAKA